ncbi:MAG: AMP-binding protein [Vulcanimicrobiota bacterium]
MNLSESLGAAWKSERELFFYNLRGLASRLSYAQFGEMVERLRDALQRRGGGPGTVVAVMGSTGPSLAAVAAAVWRAGATLTVLPKPTRLAGLEQFLAETLGKLQRSEAHVLVGEEDLVSIFRELAGIPVLSFEQVEEEDGLELETTGPGCALIQFSSGTTRDPRPIMLSEEALLSNSRAVLEQFPGGACRHSCVSWLPLYHDMGLLGCFLMPLLAPGDLTLMGPEVFALRPLTWLEAISQRRATTSSAPNFALAHCLRRISEEEVRSLDLSCWQIAMVGAEPVRPATLREFARKFAPAGFSERAFSPVYGLAEATLAVTFSPLGQGLKTHSFDLQEMALHGKVRPGDQVTPSLGKPLRGVEVEIRGPAGRALGPGELGDVWVRSPSLMSGVLGEETEQVQGGWLQTGDAGFLLEGELCLYGRRRDILLLDGRNHDPALLEESVESLEEVRRCCAFTQESAEHRDRLVLLCEVEKNYRGSRERLEEKILNVCRRRTTLRPDRVEYLQPGELPLTSSGKLRRGTAAREFAELVRP